MKISVAAALACLFISLPTYSANHEDYKNLMIAESSWWTNRIYMGAYGGYGTVDGAIENDGNFAQGRLSLGMRVGQYQAAMFDTELSVQSGNSMRLSDSAAINAALGGLPVQSTLKPFVDLLAVVQYPLCQRYPIIGILKGGIAYRQLQLNDRTSSSDYVQKVNGELMVGLGYKLTEQAMLTAYYQGIYSGSSANVTIDSTAENTFISQIPTQQAGFLGIEYTI